MAGRGAPPRPAPPRPAAALPDGRRYGYQWYLGRLRRREEVPEPADGWVGAIGNGGQRLFVLAAHGLVLATAAGNYNRADQGQAPLALLRAVLQELAG